MIRLYNIKKFQKTCIIKIISYILVFFSIIILASSCGDKRSKESTEGLYNEKFIYDHSNILSPDELMDISSMLSEHNLKGPGKIAVLILRKLPPDTSIEEYAFAKINEWPAAKDEKIDRILLLIAMENRKLRIETSKEVWNPLTEDNCKKIIDNIIVPKFRQKLYYDGIKSAILAMIEHLKS